MFGSQYKLDDNGEPVPCSDLFEWAAWLEGADRNVAKTELEDGTLVSTVFLGMDHGFAGSTPLLYETMIFPDMKKAEGERRFHESYCARYATKAEALAGHELAVRIAKGEVDG